MFFTPDRKSSRNALNRRSLRLENLENRNLLAAHLTASLNVANHILRVEGTDNNDAITISNLSGRVSVAGISIKVYNGATTSTVASLDRSQVVRVEVKALAGNDTVRMPESNLTKGAVPMTVWGGDGDDTITGGSQADRLMGENGRDAIRGLKGNDFLSGGSGYDSLHGGAGVDNLDGGAGNDQFFVDWSADTVTGGTGIDTLLAPGMLATLTDSSFKSWNQASGWFTCPLAGIESADLTAQASPLGVATIVATEFTGSCRLTGSEGNDVLYGGAGADSILGNGGNDLLIGNGGNDTINGGGGDDLIYGGYDPKAGNSPYLLYGNGGNDTIRGGEGNDEIHGDLGNDTLYGDNGNDVLFGGGGNDQVFGGDEDDQLFGDSGDDRLVGGRGTDSMDGGLGNDTLEP